jgi:hypothetical protein
MWSFAVVLALSSAAHTALAVVPPLAYVDGRVSGRFDGAAPRDALAEMARGGGLEVRGRLVDASPVTLELTDVPLDEAISRVLAGQSFTLTYRAGRLAGVRLLNAGGEDVAITPVAAPPVEAVVTLPDSGATGASHRQVAIGGRLARAIGTDRTSFTEIMGVAMRGETPRVRADALRVGLRILAAEPELRASVLDVMDHMTDEHLADWLVRTAGPYAADVARLAARSPLDESVRLRARAIEPQLRARGGDAASMR